MEHALSFSLRQLREDFPSDLDHYQALVTAYSEVPDKVRYELEGWLLEQSPEDELPILDILLIELHTMHKLLRLTHSEGMTWLSEVLEAERQSLVTWVAYLLRNSDLIKPTE